MSQCLNPSCLKRNPEATQFCQFCGFPLLLAQRYRALSILGQGGFGRTFRAVDEFQPSHPLCVIKQFLPQAQGTNDLQKAAELFEHEAIYLEKLGQHDQIPTLLAHFTQDNHQYLIQQYIPGQNLEQTLATEGVFSEVAIWQVLTDILSVLQFVHRHQVIHRDIKPENIIRRESDTKLVLVDFGASKVSQNQELSVTGTIIGSAEYTAPEQAKGKPRFASDLYSLGVTCLHLLTNISPFELYSIHEANWIWRDFLRKNSVSDKLGKILDKLVANGLKHRYQSVEEVLTDIAHQARATSPPTVIQPIPPKTVASQPTPQNVSKPSPPQPINLKRVSFETVMFIAETLEQEEKSGLFGLKTVRKTYKHLKPRRKRVEAKYFTVNLGNGVGLDLVAIPPGKFRMGSPEEEQGRVKAEGPQHWVQVSPFFMGKYPITQKQWQVVMDYNPSHFRSANRPVEKVSWHDCLKFCDKIGQKTGLTFRLPSEAEWEYACRAGTTTPFHFGEAITPKLANYNGNYGYQGEPTGEEHRQTTEVGSFIPNAFGLYDMHGNIWEWCEDDWHEDYQGAPTDGSVWRETDSRDSKVMRGGSWDYAPKYCRSASRIHNVYNYDFVGFRVVCIPPQP